MAFLKAQLFRGARLCIALTLLALITLSAFPLLRSSNVRIWPSRLDPLRGHDLLEIFESEVGSAADTNLTVPELHRRDDYTCGPGKPCRNKACCGASGYCGYGATVF